MLQTTSRSPLSKHSKKISNFPNPKQKNSTYYQQSQQLSQIPHYRIQKYSTLKQNSHSSSNQLYPSSSLSNFNMIKPKQIIQNKSKQKFSQNSRQFSPQIKIYNRNFILREVYKNNLEQEYLKQIKKNANLNKVNQQSYKILIEKLDKNIDQVVNKVIQKRNNKLENNYQENQSDSQEQLTDEEINYDQMSEIFLVLNSWLKKSIYPEPNYQIQLQKLLSQTWIYLKNYDIQTSSSSNIETFKIFMKILMDPKHLKSDQIKQLIENVLFHQLVEKYQSNRKRFLQMYPQLIDQTLEDIEIFKLWCLMRQKYYRFEGKVYENNQDRSRKKYDQSKIFTFQPQINQKSRVLAENQLKRYLSKNKLQHQKQIKKSVNNVENDISCSHYTDKHNQQGNQLYAYLATSHKRSRTNTLHQNNYHTHNVNKQNPSNNKMEQKQSIEYHELLYRRKLQKQRLSRRLQYQGSVSGHQNQGSKISSRKLPQEQINEIVNKMYFIPEKKNDINYNQLKQRQQLKKCSFQPIINQNYSSIAMKQNQIVSNQVVKGFESQVQRLTRGRKQKQKQKEIYQNLGRPKQRALSNIKMPSFIERDMPKLILEVNIGDGQIEKIKLKGDEDAKLVAKKFVNKYNLQNSMISVLEELVEENLRNL